MQLETFNQLASSQARLVLQAWAHIPTWVSELIQKRPYSSKEQQFSQREQAQIETDAVLQLALYQGNLDYEYKFGHIFLIRASGRSGQQILSELQRRLVNTVEQEQTEVRQQLSKIALLRLNQEIQ